MESKEFEEVKETGEESQETQEVEELEKEELEMSALEISGNRSYNTIRIKGKIKQRDVTVLMDSGSTKSFFRCSSGPRNSVYNSSSYTLCCDSSQ